MKFTGQQTAALPRMRTVYDMRQSGKSFDAIAKEIGVTRERVRQIVSKFEWYLETYPDSLKKFEAGK